MSTTLADWLLELSNAVLVPVVLALFGACVWTVFALGGFAREFVERRFLRRTATIVEQESRAELAGSDAGRRIDALEFDLEARLARLALAARLAPMLGLVGTLVPLGPALVDVSDGRLAGFGEKLIVAFATTVVGVLVGGACHLMAVVRRGWWARDLHELDTAARNDAESVGT